MNVPALLKNKFLIKILLLAVSIILLFALKNTERGINKSIEKAFANIRGQQQPDTNIVIIDITENDIDNLGHWPLKRSYYALLVNSLTKYKVKKIGLEVFLSAKFVTQTIYDNLLTREIQKSGRVVLSSLAGDLYYKDGKYYTDSLSYPSPKLLDENLITGHVNYFSVNGIQIPSKVYYDHSAIKSFALQLAGSKYFNDENKLLNVNFISSWKKFKTISLLNYFQLVNNNSPELNQLKDKIIIIGVSDPQIASAISTNFDGQMPGVALHAFALDNILENRGLNNQFIFPSAILFVIIIAFLVFAEKRKIEMKKIPFYIVTFMLFILISFILFSFVNLELSYSFFLIPFILLIILDSAFFLLDKKIILEGAVDETNLLKKLLENKEYELNKLQKELNLSGESGSTALLEKIKTLKIDIEKLKETEADSKETEIISDQPAREFQNIVYRSRQMFGIIELIKKVAPEEANILILGESGTGKELVAQAIHSLSKRSNNNFVAVNCGALSDTLLESELFGHVKGAFTGAVADKVGRFEAADNGTIFLDEIAETSENFQVKLLRVIQTGDYEKVGSSKTYHTNVRILAATNQKLETAVKEKKFREDLYYRLNVIKIELPPLRERRDDIAVLADYFLQKENSEIKLSEAAADALFRNEWKGNIRELEAVIKRAVIFAKSADRKLVQLADLPEEIVRDSKFNFEDLVIESLRSKKFSRSSIMETAKELGDVSRTVISENFRGYSLKTYVENEFDQAAAAKIIAGSEDEEMIGKVNSKLELFLKNIENDVNESPVNDFEKVKINFNSKYKNLPRKFHYYLDEIIKKKLE